MIKLKVLSNNKSKNIKLIVLILLTAIVVYIIDYKITAHDLDYYYGKDDGFFRRIESICLLSSLFFGVMTKRTWWIQSLIGFIVGILSSIVSYFLWYYLFDDNGLSFHIISCLLSILTFFLIQKD